MNMIKKEDVFDGNDKKIVNRQQDRSYRHHATHRNLLDQPI